MESVEVGSGGQLDVEAGQSYDNFNFDDYEIINYTETQLRGGLVSTKYTLIHEGSSNLFCERKSTGSIA